MRWEIYAPSDIQGRAHKDANKTVAKVFLKQTSVLSRLE